MKKHTGILISAATLSLSVVMMLLFPREKNVPVSAVFAVLFWLSLSACILYTVAAVRNRGKPPKDSFSAKASGAERIKGSERRRENSNEKTRRHKHDERR